MRGESPDAAATFRGSSVSTVRFASAATGALAAAGAEVLAAGVSAVFASALATDGGSIGAVLLTMSADASAMCVAPAISRQEDPELRS